VGCDTADVLKAAGLRWANLFTGPPLSQAEQAALNQKREEDEWDREYLHNLHGAGCDRLHHLRGLTDSLGARLMRMPDSAEADALTAQFHQMLDEARRLESVLIRIERWFR
jgi:hypothetical protein